MRRRTVECLVVLAIGAGVVSIGAQGSPGVPGQAAATIHQAAQAGDAGRVAALLDATPALVADRDQAGRTPLHRAARSGYLEVVELLFARGAALGARDASEDSPCHAAAQAGKWTVVDWLVTRAPAEQVVALNLADFDGNTLLHLASRGGRADTVGLLASKSVELDARNAMGQTAYNLAEEAGFPAVAAFLAGKGADRSAARFPRLSGPYLGQAPPGMMPQIFAKGIVSTRQGVYSTIVFSLEHGEAFWHPEAEGVLFMKVGDGFWSAPRRFPFTARPSINVPFLSPDGRRLYFMAGTRTAEGMVDKEEIWFVERTPSGWSEPRAFDATVNSVPMHWQFSMDRQGNVYYSAGGAIGGIAVARFEDGRYRAPEKLSAPVNLPHTPEEKYRTGELGPFISPNGDYLIFTKFGSGGGLRVSFRQPDGTWGEPKNLSDRLGMGSDSAPQVTQDGKYLFFQSVRPGSSPHRSFYWVDARVIDALR